MLKPGNLEFVVCSSKLNLKLNLNVNLYEGHNSIENLNDGFLIAILPNILQKEKMK